MGPYYVSGGYDLHLDGSVVAFSIYVRYCGTACVISPLGGVPLYIP